MNARAAIKPGVAVERTRDGEFAALAGSGFFETWKPDPVGLILGTGYMRFTTAHGIDGLARLDGEGGLDCLAVIAREPGKGQFRRFIAAAKKSFRRVAVWEDWNPVIGKALKRYKFRRARCVEADGEVSEGWEWRSPNLNSATPHVK